MDPYAIEYLHRDRLRRFEKNAALNRMVREARTPRPSLVERFAAMRRNVRIEVDNGLGLRPFRPAI
jgi:hypothetical protein